MIESPTEPAAEDTIEHKMVLALRLGVPAVIACIFLWRIFGIRDPATRFYDDFFYYLVPAERWVDGTGSTFFPGELTNGYHPLWFLCVAMLYRVAGGGAVFFGALDLGLMALMVGFFFLFEKFLRRVTGERLAAAVGAAVAAIALVKLASSGLETALAVFAAALLLGYLSGKPLAERTTREAALVGVLAAFLVLSRLDAALLLFGLALAVVPRWGWRRLAALAAGAAPIYLYLAFNLWAFGDPVPTSMAAKTLDVYVPPNWHFLDYPSPGVGIVAVVMTAVIVVSTTLMLRRNHNVDVRGIASALPIALVLQFGAQALFSGWMLFGWYAYIAFMGLGLTAALLIVELRRAGWPRPVGIPVAAITLAVVPTWIVFLFQPDPWQVDIAAIARRLQEFSRQHPGVYAIGDVAGTPRWMFKQPIVQLEGLVMSHAFIDRIRRRQSLGQVFRDYHVNYYVATAPWGADKLDKNGCHEFLEPSPWDSSPRAPHMAMTICVAPVAVIDPGLRTHPAEWIFRIDPVTGKAIS